MSRARDVARSAQTALYRIPSNENTSASECSDAKQLPQETLTPCRRLSQLQHEAEELRKQLGSDRGSNNNRLASPIAVLTAAAEMSRTPESLNAYTPAISSPQSSIRVDAPQIIPSNVRPPPVVPVVAREMPIAHSDGETQPRSLNSAVQIEGGEINDIFQMSVYIEMSGLLSNAMTDSSATMHR